MDNSLASRFERLFSGARCAHGCYDASIAPTQSDTGKQQVRKYETKRATVLPEHYSRHLGGYAPLGVIPITEENTCGFGAIDVDAYNDLNHAEVARRAANHGLPLIVARSKSGGAHLYLFATEPIPAQLMRARLADIAATLGFGGSEIFPKQAEIDWGRGDLGSWINLPYFDGLKRLRYAVRADDGEAMELDEFLEAAEALRQPQSWFAAPLRAAKSDILDGPPCLEHLIQIGVSSGSRNSALFNFGVYARKRFGDTWEAELEGMNRQYMTSPLPSSEVAQVIKSLKRKDYGYKCADAPIAAHCNRAKCLTRKHGIGAGGDVLRIDSIRRICTDPVEFYASIGGKTVCLLAAELQFPLKVQKACIEQGAFCPPVLPKQQEWAQHLSEVMAICETIEPSPDLTVSGRIEESLRKFLTGRAQAATRGEILQGKPYRNENDEHEFKMDDFRRFLQRQGSAFQDRDINRTIKALGGESCPVRLGGLSTRIWKVPSMPEQTEPFELPKGIAEERALF